MPDLLRGAGLLFVGGRLECLAVLGHDLLEVVSDVLGKAGVQATEGGLPPLVGAFLLLGHLAQSAGHVVELAHVR